jgi:hypothetical protein
VRVNPMTNTAVSNRVIGQMLTCCGSRLLRIAPSMGTKS